MSDGAKPYVSGETVSTWASFDPRRVQATAAALAASQARVAELEAMLATDNSHYIEVLRLQDEKQALEAESAAKDAALNAMKGERDMWEERANNPRSAVQLTEAQVALNAMREALEQLDAAVWDRLYAKGSLSTEYAQSTAARIKAALSLEAVKLAADAQARRDEAVAALVAQVDGLLNSDLCACLSLHKVEGVRAALAKVKP